MYFLISRTFRFVSLAVIALSFGCIPSEPPEEELPPLPPPQEQAAAPTSSPRAPVDVPALQEEWLALAEAQNDAAWNPRAFEIAAILSQQGPDALRPLIETIAMSQDDPYKMVFAVQSLEQFMTMAHRDYLVELLDSDDMMLRASAARLLAGIPDEAVQRDLRPLLEDSDPRVQFSARLGLAKWDPEIRAGLLESYDDPEMTMSHKLQIAGIILSAPQEADMAGLAKIVADPETSTFHRVQAGAQLGRMGDASVLDELEASLESSDDAAYEEMARAAIAAIKQRTADTNGSTPTESITNGPASGAGADGADTR